jgi:hypothetical protein
MKKLVKMILVAIPALVLAAAVGMTTIGCGDDTTTMTAGNDLTVPVVHDLATGGARDMAMTKTGD